MIKKNEKIIVVGAGCCGLSIVLALLNQGYENVHLFDKRDYVTQEYSYFKGCDSPSSDLNKFFRAAYGKEVHYQKMAEESLIKVKKWNQMIKESNWEGGEPLFFRTGNAYLTDGTDLDEFQRSSCKSMGPNKAIRMSDSDARKRVVAEGIDPCTVDIFGTEWGVEGIVDTVGGTILADKACRWVLHLCKTTGGSRLTTHLGAPEGVVDHLIEIPGSSGKKTCLGIKTKDGLEHKAAITICACGPWLPSVVSEAQEKVEATAGTVCLVKITDPVLLDKFDERKFPPWSFKTKDIPFGGIYGFPIRDGYMKFGFRGLKWTNPQPKLNSSIVTKWSETEQRTNVPLFGLLLIKNFIREHIPEIKGKIDVTRLCWYGDSEDDNYLIDFSPYHDKDSLFVVGGDSGHAFKMIGRLGDVIVPILNREGDKFLTELFSWKRVREKKNMINKGLSDPRALINLKMSTEADLVI